MLLALLHWPPTFFCQTGGRSRRGILQIGFHAGMCSDLRLELRPALRAGMTSSRRLLAPRPALWAQPEPPCGEDAEAQLLVPAPTTKRPAEEAQTSRQSFAARTQAGTRVAAARKGRRTKLLAADRILAQRIRTLRPEVTFLQLSRLRPATQSKYAGALERVLAWWRMRSLPDWAAGMWDAALQDYLEELYEQGANRGEASSVVAALLWLRPELGGTQKAALPLSAASLRGWAKLEPGFTRPPLPYAIALAAALWLAEHSQQEAALLVWMLFETYLRVSEALSMNCEDLVESAHLSDGKWTPVTVMACSSSRHLATKTGDQDLSLPLDLARQAGLAALLSGRARGRSANEALWDLSYAQLADAFHMALAAIGAAPLKATLHSLRHGGASHDRQTGSRSWQSVQQSGNWKAQASVHRYEKHGLLAKELQKLPKKVVESANAATKKLLLSFGALFAMPCGRRRAGTKLSLICSQEPEVSQQTCGEEGMLALTSMSCVVRTLTSRGRSSTAPSAAGSTRGW